MGNFGFLLERNTFQLVIFQSCFFAGHRGGAEGDHRLHRSPHLMHNIPPRNQRIWRGLLLVPWVIPLAHVHARLVVAVRSVLLGVQLGAEPLGFRSVPWLGQAWIARLCIVAVNVWYGTPFFMIMYLAALKSVPEQLYEAAAIDGAGAAAEAVLRHPADDAQHHRHHRAVQPDRHLRRFRHRAHPHRRRPAGQTHLFATYAFEVGIQSGDIPLGAPVSLFMFPILAVAAFFVLRGVTRRSKEIAA